MTDFRTNKPMQQSEQRSKPHSFDSGSDRAQGYQQALQDFKVTELIDAIKTLATSRHELPEVLNAAELEIVAVLLIQQLIVTLQQQPIATSLWGLQDDNPMVTDLPAVELKGIQALTVLPDFFSKKPPTPTFADGAVVRWIEWLEYPAQAGVVLGHFYAYARHLRQWAWKYVVWLQPPFGQVVIDTAWETDLETWIGEADHE